MKRFALKLTIAVAAFFIGIAATAFWFFDAFTLTVSNSAQVVEVAPPVLNGTNDDEQYAIYSVLINKFFLTSPIAKAGFLNASIQTSSDNHFGYMKSMSREERLSNLKKLFPTVGNEELADFAEKQLQPINLSAKFNTPIQYNLIDETKAKLASQNQIRFSQVGFNRDKTRAIVEIDYSCPLCGFGKHIFLEKENGDWKVKEVFEGWVS